MRIQTQTIAESVEAALALADAAETTKQAAAAPDPATTFECEIGALLRKTAASVRQNAVDVTYEDLHQFVEGKL